MTETIQRPVSRRGGPPLPVPIAAYAVLTVAVLLTFPGPGPTPDAGAALTTLQEAPVRTAVWAVLYAGSALPLVVWTAAVVHRLQVLGARVAGPFIGLVGGVLAAGALLMSALTGWTAGQIAPDGDAGAVHALSTLSFGLGGVGFALPTALLLAGVAIPCLVLGLVPRALAVTGIVLAVLAAASVLALAVPALTLLLPVARFGGLLWFVAVSVALPLDRREARGNGA